MTNQDEILKNFMLEHFDFGSLKKAGVFKGLKKNDYKAQADKICYIFGYKTVFEYGTEEIRCHISYVGDRPLAVNEHGQLTTDPFVTVIESWLDK